MGFLGTRMRRRGEINEREGALLGKQVGRYVGKPGMLCIKPESTKNHTYSYLLPLKSFRHLYLNKQRYLHQ